MRCLHCRKKIGLLRRWVDRQFCCDDHRRRTRQAYSARLARDLAREDPFEDAWLVTLNTPRKAKSASFGPGSGILLVVVATVLVLFLPAGDTNGPPRQTISYLPPVQGFRDKITGILPGTPKLSLRED